MVGLVQSRGRLVLYGGSFSSCIFSLAAVVAVFGWQLPHEDWITFDLLLEYLTRPSEFPVRRGF